MKYAKLSCPHLSVILTAFISFAFFSLAGCIPLEKSTHNTRKQPSTLQVTTYQRLVNDLAADDMEGRGVGYTGLIKARNYITDDLQKNRIAPGFKKTDQNPSEYLQAFEIFMPVTCKEKSLTLSHQTDQVKVNKTIQSHEFNVMGISSSNDFNGKKVVFAGYGIEAPEYAYNSYAGADTEMFEDAVIVLLRYEPLKERESQWAQNLQFKMPWTDHATILKKAKLAESKGASAVIVVNPPNFSLLSLQTTAGSTAAGHELSIPVFQAKTSFLNQLFEANGQAKHMSKVCESKANRGKLKPFTFNNIKITGKANVIKPDGHVQNVAGIIKGCGNLENEVIVVGAHYDHLGYGEYGSMSGVHDIHNGADDNASGTAMVMMLASVFQKKTNMQANKNRRTVVFTFFSAEEHGLHGSRYMTSHLNDLDLPENANIVAMLNYDMVGRIRENKIDIYETSTWEEWENHLQSANRQIEFDINMPEQAPGMSDHSMFIARKIPSIIFFSGFHEDYHCETDTADKINAKDAGRLLLFSEQLLDDLATREEPITFNEQHENIN